MTEDNISRAFGVEAVIREFETPGSMIRSILPLRLTREGDGARKTEAEVVAVVSVIFGDYEKAGEINALFHEYRNDVLGRMGMPCGEAHVINVILRGSLGRITALTDRLNRLEGVRAKATAAPEEGEDQW